MTRMLAGLVALGLALLAGGEAFADGRNVPAPIPVPAPVPIPEGFTYYLRGDLGWAFAAAIPRCRRPVRSTAPRRASPSPAAASGTDDVFFGGFGAGAYLTPRFRADVTFDFRGQQDVDATATYVDGADTGTVRETVKLRGTVGLINGYWDLWQRGHFTPYVGAGIGFVYNDIQRDNLTTESPSGTTVTGSSSDTHSAWRPR